MYIHIHFSDSPFLQSQIYLCVESRIPAHSDFDLGATSRYKRRDVELLLLRMAQNYIHLNVYRARRLRFDARAVIPRSVEDNVVRGKLRLSTYEER